MLGWLRDLLGHRGEGHSDDDYARPGGRSDDPSDRLVSELEHNLDPYDGTAGMPAGWVKPADEGRPRK